MASYEVYDADIRVQSGDDAEACYALGSRVMESVMGFRGLVESGDSVALCELRAPLSLKRAVMFTPPPSAGLRRLAADRLHLHRGGRFMPVFAAADITVRVNTGQTHEPVCDIDTMEA